MLASIVIRTLNEEQYLDQLLSKIAQQETVGLEHEVVLIDSGSIDNTVEIARRHGARITHISREEFSFGRSLNLGSNFAKGNILVYISGHCIPVDEHWLQNLCQPLLDERAAYSYGRQIGDDSSFLSERRIFAKYFPLESQVPQDGFFCNNANSALLRSSWEAERFDEGLTGLEDMELAKRLVNKKQKVAYVAEAPVYHLHNETWAQVRRRFEREALALQIIMPEIHLRPLDALGYIMSAVVMDNRAALRAREPFRHFYSILRYRIAQFSGSYVGNREHRKLSARQKAKFFYPQVSEKDAHHVKGTHGPNRRPASDEGKQPAGER